MVYQADRASAAGEAVGEGGGAGRMHLRSCEVVQVLRFFPAPTKLCCWVGAGEPGGPAAGGAALQLRRCLHLQRGGHLLPGELRAGDCSKCSCRGSHEADIQ